jgi:ethanolamine ammonia-lyase small subunit
MPDAWQHLKTLTTARIALGRAGGSLPTRALLEFQMAHARARDAVHEALDAHQLAGQISGLGHEVLVVESAAGDKETYLKRPDLGRRLSEESRTRLASRPRATVDLVIVVSDGLSALAAHRQAVPLLAELLPRLERDRFGLAPLIVARFGRVAIADEIGAICVAKLALILLGERPGLGSPDSLGAYFVFGPRDGCTDAMRNCVSNIRPEGLTPQIAAATLQFLLGESLRRRVSGVSLKLEGGLPAIGPALHKSLE